MTTYHPRPQSPVVGILIPLVLICGYLAIATPAGSQTNGQKEEFTASAINTSNLGRTGIQQVQMSVDRWTTASERQMLAKTLTTDGPQKLLEQLRRAKAVGMIRTPDSIGYDLRYSHQEAEPEGGRRIILATDRPISFWEQVNQPRSIDYPFTVIELHIRPDGHGEGKMSIATKITADGDVIELENYADQPVRLENVESMIKKASR